MIYFFASLAAFGALMCWATLWFKRKHDIYFPLPCLPLPFAILTTTEIEGEE
jgi:hypothetical protein